jgi:hypothetical protein
MDKIFSKIISGGQTGVDRAALDVALELVIHVETGNTNEHADCHIKSINVLGHVERCPWDPW